MIWLRVIDIVGLGSLGFYTIHNSIFIVTSKVWLFVVKFPHLALELLHGLIRAHLIVLGSLALALVLIHKLCLLLVVSLASTILDAFLHVEVHLHVIVGLVLVVCCHVVSLIDLVGLNLLALHSLFKVHLHLHVSLLLD